MGRPATLRRAPKRRRLKSREETETVVTSMVLPRELHKRAMVTAYDLNWSMAELVRQAVGDWLDRHVVELPRRGRA
jgi:hypothetical protein